ncbi:MAG: hypothetical protein OQK24_05960 [Magnetovibrio sp.]|nr:hypothetical protein [Magnetovibrio sp.]
MYRLFPKPIAAKLTSGAEVLIYGPTMRVQADGSMFVSHQDFHATLNGEDCILNVEHVDEIAFPSDDVITALNKFEQVLPEVLKAWRSLAELEDNDSALDYE